MLVFSPMLVFVVLSVDLFLLFWVGARIGFFNTMIILVLTAFAGIQVGKQYGRDPFRSLQGKDLSGDLIQNGVESTVRGLAAAVLLFIPGYVTDIMGLSLLVPGLRGWFGWILSKQIHSQYWPGRNPDGGSEKSGAEKFGRFAEQPDSQRSSDAPRSADAHHSPETIDGEYSILDDDEDSKPSQDPRLH